MDWIVILENPRDIKIAISFCLFKTSNDKDEIILNDVIAMISISMITLPFFVPNSLEQCVVGLRPVTTYNSMFSEKTF